MRHTPFVIYFTTSILPMTKVTNLFISMKKLSKLAKVDSEMQLREVIESFLIKRTISLLWPLMKNATSLIWQCPLLGGTQQMAVLCHISELQPTKDVWSLTVVLETSVTNWYLWQNGLIWAFSSHTWWPLTSNCFQHQNVQGNIPDPTAIAFLHLTALIAFIHTVLPERGK